MISKDNKRLFRIISGIVFVYFAGNQIYGMISGHYFNMLSLLYTVSYALLATGCFVPHEILFMAGSFLLCISYAWGLTNIISWIKAGFSIKYILPYYISIPFCIASFGLLGYLIFNKKKQDNIFYYLPGILYFAGYIVRTISYIINGYTWLDKTLFNFIVMLAAIVLYCLQLMPEKEQGTTIDSIPKEKAVIASRNTEDVIEQLTKLKELADKGIITEEEFTDKKKELLNK